MLITNIFFLFCGPFQTVRTLFLHEKTNNNIVIWFNKMIMSCEKKNTVCAFFGKNKSVYDKYAMLRHKTRISLENLHE